jgi:hypothetical protein
LLENKEESTSTRLQESTHALSPPQNSEHTNDIEKINCEVFAEREKKA